MSKENPAEITNMLKATFENVDDETFEFDGEKIRYWVCAVNEFNNGSFFIHNRSKTQNYLEELSKTEDKAFLFCVFKDITGWFFSLEIKDYNPNPKKNVQLCKPELLNDYISKGNDIFRIAPPKDVRNGNEVYVVGIKIGSEESDKERFRNYVTSSDNRTYNNVIRIDPEYIIGDAEPIKTVETCEMPHNYLVSGAPGTGKSHYLDEKVKLAGGAKKPDKKSEDDKSEYEIITGSCIDLILHDEKIKGLDEEDIKIDKTKLAIQTYCDKYVTRVTFYEDYSYENFIGCYRPVPKESKANIKYAENEGTITEEKICYEYVPGPFIETYIKAKNDKKKIYFLLIEEINRAKAASVFGDMFQLLDRDEEGISEYEIKPESSLDNYLSEHLNDYKGSLKLPSNMYIWATMNSADQAVLPLDAAFKRRWTQKYMDIASEENRCPYQLVLPINTKENREILWDNIRIKINKVITDNNFDEDRCIGPWYFKKLEIEQINAFYSEEGNDGVNPLVDKLFYYLRQDVFRRNPDLMFRDAEEKGTSMSALRRRVREKEPLTSILNIDITEPEPSKSPEEKKGEE